MTTSIQYVVDVEASLDEAPALAERVAENLINRGIVLRTPQVHSYLGQGARYAVGPNAGSVATYNQGFPCGFDIKIGRQFSWTGELGVNAIHCPFCDASHAPSDMDFPEALVEWCERVGPGLLHCSVCKSPASIANWRFEPTCGFGNLTLEFSEWFLEEDFVEEISALLGHRIAWVKSQW